MMFDSFPNLVYVMTLISSTRCWRTSTMFEFPDSRTNNFIENYCYVEIILQIRKFDVSYFKVKQRINTCWNVNHLLQDQFNLKNLKDLDPNMLVTFV